MPLARKASTRFTGWRGGVLACVVLVACCVLIEIALLVVAIKLDSLENGLGTLYRGSCAGVKNLSNYLLIPLNVLGTVKYIPCGSGHFPPKFGADFPASYT